MVGGEVRQEERKKEVLVRVEYLPGLRESDVRPKIFFFYISENDTATPFSEYILDQVYHPLPQR